MVKTADVGLRAKARLARELATPMSTAAAQGEKAYLRGGCNGCHVIGQVSSGPDLTGAVARKGEKWVYEFTLNPESKFNEPYVKAIIEYFNLRMPNQHMSEQESKDIVEYLKWVDDNADLF